MKLLLAQINPTVGALENNCNLICSTINQFSSQVDIIVIPELALTGYPPGDLLLESHFLRQTEQMLNRIVDAVSDSAVIMGTVRRSGSQLFNTAAIMQNHKLLGYRDKTLLPTYDVFDEDRYFTPAASIETIDINFHGKPIKIGVEICEDLWAKDYQEKVTDELIRQHPEIVINISASPYCLGKTGERLNLVKGEVSKGKIWFVYCNLVGAQDELIFDGNSFVVNPQGQLISTAKPFEPDFLILDTETTTIHTRPKQAPSEELFYALTLGVRDYFKKTGFEKAIIGLSGGIDSALTCAIAVEALGPTHVIGVAMPSVFSSDHSVLDAKKLAENLKIEFHLIPISLINEQYLDAVDPVFKDTHPGLAEENLQARIRGNILMAIANKIGGLVLNTGNKTEVALGYCTLYGDMCGALGVISDLNKIQVYQLSQWLNENKGTEIIPDNTLTKPPSAELKPDQVDPFDYETVSPLVDEIIHDHPHRNDLISKGYDEKLVLEILTKIRINEHKRRQAAPGLRVSQKAFGVGRRYPIVNGFRG